MKPTSTKEQNEASGWFLYPLDIFPQKFFLKVNADDNIHQATRENTNAAYFRYDACTCPFEYALSVGYKWSADGKRWQEFGVAGKND